VVPPGLRPEIEDLAHATDADIRRLRHALVREEVAPARGFRLTFLGTGGNPTNLVGQQRGTGGFHLVAEPLSLFVDPGPGAIGRAVAQGVELRNLDGVFVSHGHTDHVLCAGAIVEAMCRGMTARQGVLLAPEEVLASGQISRYHQGALRSEWYPGGPEAVVALAPGRTVPLGEARLTPVRAVHGGENFGFRLEHPRIVVGYTSDTRYLRRYRTWDGVERLVRPGEKLERFGVALEVEESLVEAFAAVDVLVLNVSFFDQHAHRHLTLFGAADLLRRTGARLGVLSHFDPSLGSPPERAAAAARIAAELAGPEVVAAADGMVLDLARWCRR
jgi:hypothetical protein